MWGIFVLLLSLQAIAIHVAKITESDQIWYEEKLLRNEVGTFNRTQFHVLRLQPGEDLLDSLFKFARVKNITAASIVSTVGSLTKTNIRYANDEEGTSLEGHFEIVSLVGNIDYQNGLRSVREDRTGSGHVHISCSDENGITIGGHLLPGNIIYTTAEITLVELLDGLFVREPDLGPNGSGYYELKVYENT